MEARYRVRPSGSNWGEFGPDDQLGRVNLIDSRKILQGIAEVREGRTFCLSMPLDYPGGNYHDLRRKPPKLAPVMRDARPKYNMRPNAKRPDIYCDDCVELYTHYSTHWDGLAHVGSMFDADGDGKPEHRYYNGYRGGEEVPFVQDGSASFRGVAALGIEHLAQAGLQGRGVMIDLFGMYGAKRRLVGYDDLMRAMEATGAEVETGDMVCLHTGQTAEILRHGRNPPVDVLEDAFCHLDGCDERLLRWVEESGLSALIADNYAVEAVPPARTDDGFAYERLHETCIFKLGIPLGELWHLGELAAWLAANGRTRFLLTAPPLRLPGAVGSPVTPIATV